MLTCLFFFASRVLECLTSSCKHCHDQMRKAKAEITQFFSQVCGVWVPHQLEYLDYIFDIVMQMAVVRLLIHLFTMHLIHSLHILLPCLSCFNYVLKITSFDHQCLYFISMSVFNYLIIALVFERDFFVTIIYSLKPLYQLFIMFKSQTFISVDSF